MQNNQIICPRCSGLKKMYKVGDGWSSVNFGGVKADCPLCVGVGKIKSLETALNELEVSTPIKSEDLKVHPEVVNVVLAKKGRPKSSQLSLLSRL